MARKINSIILITVWLSSLILILTVQAVRPLTVSANGTIWYDTDGDGISDQIETEGWYNDNGVRYPTLPNNPDSDNDGLTDGEEQLYGTDPLNKNSPGLYVKYENRFQTRKYFSDVQFDDDATGYLRGRKSGNRFLSMPADMFKGDGNNHLIIAPPFPLPNYYDANDNEEERDVGFVVRRGTTFFLGGDTSQTLSLNASGFTGSSFTITPDPCRSGWNITVPTTAKLGTYRATLSLGKVLPIAVIFELPSTDGTNKPTHFSNPATSPYINQFISNADVAAFLYNDDPKNSRDESAVIWMTRQGWYKLKCSTSPTVPCDDQTPKTNYYHVSDGYAQSFWTDQYKKYIFRDLVMDAVKGENSTQNAVNALANRTDLETRVNYNLVHNRAEIPLRFNESGKTTRVAGACQDVAGVLTGLSRSAGILARPYITDYKTQKYNGDESDATSTGLGETTVNGWYDTYTMIWDNTNQKWARTRGYRQQEITDLDYPYAHGYTSYNQTFPGDGSYTDQRGDLIITANSGWNYWDIATKKGMVNTIWTPSWADMEFNDHSWTEVTYDYRWDSRYPQNMARLNPAVDTLTVPFWHGDGWTANNWTTNRPNGPKYAYGLPLNSYNSYSPENWPFEPIAKKCPPSMDGESCPNGTLDAFTAPSAEPTPAIEWDELPKIQNQKSKIKNNLYGTVPINPEIESGAKFNDRYSSFASDTNGDGYADALIVEIGAGVTHPGSYMATAQLFDSNNEWIGQANSITKSESVIPNSQFVIQFNNMAGRIGPYTMKSLYLIGQYNDLLDSRDSQLLPYSAALAESGPIQFNYELGITNFDPNSPKSPVISPSIQFNHVYLPMIQNNYELGITNEEPPVIRNSQFVIESVISPLDAGFTPTLVYTATPHVGNDGLYDKLALNVQVLVTTADDYRLEGWLVDPDGDLIALSSDPLVSLSPGYQTLPLTFDGRAISNHGALGPYTVVALKVLDKNGVYNVLHRQEETGWSLNYQANQFSPKIIFHDNGESGSGQWNSPTFWNLNSSQFHSPTNAWQESASNGQNSSLQSKIINASDYANLALRFNSCASTGGSDTAQTQVGQGGVWTTADNLSPNTAQRWTNKFISLPSSFDESANLELSFLSQDKGNLQWMIDDVHLSGWPAIKFASITLMAGTVGSTPVTFKADYDSIVTTLPITYTWFFNDGTADQIQVITITNIITHAFPTASEYPITVTIENPYHHFDASILAGTGKAVEETAFTLDPIEPQVGKSVTFTASYLPNDATNLATAPMRYRWDFGDGTTTLPFTQSQISHTYSSGGSREIKLVTSNGYGTAMSSQLITLKEAVSEISNVYANPAPSVQHDPTTFTALFSPTTASLPVTTHWDFGDGSSGVAVTTTAAVHAFDHLGQFTITVTADNSYGGTALYTKLITVTGKPLTSIIFTPTTATPNNAYQAVFSTTYSPLNATSPITYSWDFDNNGSFDLITSSLTYQTIPTVTYSFTGSGSHSVKLMATNGYSGSISYWLNVVTPFDSDQDGVDNSSESLYGTDPTKPDSDGDGLTDGEEVLYNGFHFDSNFEVVPRHLDSGTRITSDPKNPDSDGDGLTDSNEAEQTSLTSCPLYSLSHRCFRWRTHPRDPDTDKDGLTDGEENGSYTTSAIHNDTDGDRLGDYLETKIIGTSGSDDDSDFANGLTVGDGINDRIEVGGGDPLNPNFIFTTTVSNTIVYSINNSISPTRTVPFDTDGDGLIDAFDLDSENDTISDNYEYIGSNGLIYHCTNTTTDQDKDGKANCKDNDSDGDGLPNYRDPDADNDGLLDKQEGIKDRNANGIPDFLEPGPALLGVSFTTTPLVPLANQNVTFAPIFTPSNSPLPISYIWNFGDGSPLVQSIITPMLHAFSANGDYHVIVTATNKYDDLSAVYSAIIGIGANPMKSVSIEITNYELGITKGSNSWKVPVNEAIEFTALVSPSYASRPITYTWNFYNYEDNYELPITDYDPNSPFVIRNFSNVGNYTVTVLAEHAFGPAQTNKLLLTVGRPITAVSVEYAPSLLTENNPVVFTATISPPDFTLPLSYTWQIGDSKAETSSTRNKSYTFTTEGIYPYIITASNGYGEAGTQGTLIVGRPTQGISISRDLTSPQQHDAVTFMAVITPANPTPPMRYIWNFSDSGKDIITTSAIITRTYHNLGSYTATVTVMNGYGSVSEWQTFTVGGRPLGEIKLSSVTNSLLDGEPINFFTSISPTNATQPITYTWNFGDNSPTIITTSNAIDHLFSGVGNYVIRVEAINGGNALTVASVITVSVVGRKLEQTTFTYKPPFLLEGEVMTFVATPAPLSATHPITYSWNFYNYELGITNYDPNSQFVISNSPVITHLFNKVGNYIVVLSATNGFTLSGTPWVSATKTIIVEGQPVKRAFFTYALASDSVEGKVGVSDMNVVFTSTHEPAPATRPIIYEWSFSSPEGMFITSTTNITLIHNFTLSGTYSVKMTANNGYGSAFYTDTVIIPLDSDKDGLGDITELKLGTDPHNADSDGDGLLDGLEIKLGLNPLSVDSDSDGIPDNIEVGADSIHALDTDGDGIIDALDIDSDGDTIPDKTEGNIHSDDDGFPDYQDSDSDGDGLSDYLEVAIYHTNPILLDSDADGVTDGQEVSAGINPLKTDSDDDTIPDSVEGGDYLHPRDTDNDGVIDALDPDSDNDNISDDDESRFGIWDLGFWIIDDFCTNLVMDQDGDGIPNCQDNDADGDGLPNYRDFDSDNDTATDLFEGTADYNKNNVSDFIDPTIREGKIKKTFLPVILKQLPITN